jgi:ketosteroid isomerase-like protein
MPTSSKTLIDLENRFWQAIVDEDADTAADMLTEPALMVSSHGAMQFDHDGYRQMAKKGLMVLKSFELSDMKVVFPNDDTAVLTYHVKQNTAQRGDSRTTVQEMNDSSTWIRSGDRWLCVMHTESPAGEKPPH